jgi:hypothetical protein
MVLLGWAASCAGLWPAKVQAAVWMHVTSLTRHVLPAPFATVILQGGVSAERAEREVLQQEAEATAAAHRQAFDDMVAAARAAPDTAPHDPLRFRAVPPGKGHAVAGIGPRCVLGKVQLSELL